MASIMSEAASLEQHAGKPGCCEPFLGSWSLISAEHVLPNGEVLKPFGDSPLGSILYQADGHMSAQVSVGNPGKLASDDPSQASVEEASEAWRTYLGYWGSFQVFAQEGIVVHSVEGSSFPNWIGTELVRHFRFDGGGRLILEAHAPSGHYTLIWQKRID
jgi:hypothetical protein